MTELVQQARVEDGITLLTLARPAARNALTMEMVSQLAAVLDAVDRDRGCRAVVLAGEGRAFCAGLDLKESSSGPEPRSGAIDWMVLQEHYAGLILKLRRMRQPVIAAVQGAAAGIGFGIALASDIRITDPTATFLIGAVKLGLTAGECGISYHLPRLVGAGRAFEIMLTGRAIGAEEALAIGLTSRIVESAKLTEEALAIARAVVANSPYASKHTKHIMWTNLEAPSLEAAVQLENHAQVVGLVTEDFKEAALAFGEKRPAAFKGK